MYVATHSPVRPLPALQWMATTFSSLSARKASTSSQNSRSTGSAHGLWSSKGKRLTEGKYPSRS